MKNGRKEAGYRKAPGGVSAFPYFLVLLIYAQIFKQAVSNHLPAYFISLSGV
jgi:hypothetical protein